MSNFSPLCSILEGHSHAVTAETLSMQPRSGLSLAGFERQLRRQRQGERLCRKE